MQQPGKGGVHLRPQTEVDQRVDRKGTIAYPAVAIVVVAVTADPFGQ